MNLGLPLKLQRLFVMAQGIGQLNQSSGQSIPLPAPTEGMNTRDGVSSLRPTECRSLKNMLAERGKCVIRGGKTAHQSISGVSSISTMFTHEGVSANVLLAAADGEIYDATGSPSALTTASYGSDVWSMAQFNDTTVAVNGQDTPFAFDGSTVSASGLSGSGLTITNLRTVHVVGVRMWFTEVNQAHVWYLPVNSVTGTLTKFDLGQETKGGYCVGVYGFGANTLFIMSTGEILAYEGDPGTTFSFNKRYETSLPVGFDPGIDVNGEIVLMTAAGPLPFEAIAQGLDDSNVGSWGKIAPSWADDFNNYGSQSGWNSVFFKGLVILNLQLDSTTSKQWVFNTRTNSWSYFEELNGYQFTEDDGVLYFAEKGSNDIYTYSGGTDAGSSITGIIRGGFTYPFQSQVNGEYTAARLNVDSTGYATAQVQVDTDYKELGISAPEYQISSSGSGAWGEAWGEAWGSNGQPILLWSSVSGFGRAVAPVVKFNSQADDLSYYGIELITSQAGVIG